MKVWVFLKRLLQCLQRFLATALCLVKKPGWYMYTIRCLLPLSHIHWGTQQSEGCCHALLNLILL